jgi:hypothetical protein
MEDVVSTWGPMVLWLFLGVSVIAALSRWQARQYRTHLAKVEATNAEVAAINRKHFDLNHKQYNAANDADLLLIEIKTLLEKRTSGVAYPSTAIGPRSNASDSTEPLKCRIMM